MTTQTNRYDAFMAWEAATKALQQAVFPPVGHEAPSMEAKMKLVAELEQKFAEFKAAYGL